MIDSCFDYSNKEGAVNGPWKGLKTYGNPKGAYFSQRNKKKYVNICENDLRSLLFENVCQKTSKEFDPLYALAVPDIERSIDVRMENSNEIAFVDEFLVIKRCSFCFWRLSVVLTREVLECHVQRLTTGSPWV